MIETDGHLRTQALVLHAAPYRETSLLLHVLTPEYGRLSLVARGTLASGGAAGKAGRRKPPSRGGATAAPFDLFQVLDVQFRLRPGATIATLGRHEVLHHYGRPRTDLAAYGFLSFWFEILHRVTHASLPASELFDETVHLFSAVERGEQIVGNECAVALLNLLRELGHALSVERCIRCANGVAAGSPAHIDVAMPGLVGGECAAPREPLFPLDAELHRWLYSIEVKRAAVAISPAAFSQLLELVAAVIAEHVEGPLQSLPFLQKVLAP